MQIITRSVVAILLTAAALLPSQGSAQGRVPIPLTPEFNRFDLATYSFAATARGDVPAVVRVRLDSHELLHVVLELWGRSAGYGIVPDQTTRRALSLSPAAFDDLLGDVQELSTAEIRAVRSGVICQVVPNAQMRAGVLAVRRDYDPQTDAFLGAPAVVQSATGCWNPIQINLLQPEDRELAGQFRAKLEIFAAQILRHQLIEVLRLR